MSDIRNRRRHEGNGSLEQSLQWALGLLVLGALLSITLAGSWLAGQAAEHFVASRLAHDAEALIAGLTPETGEPGRPLPPVYNQPFSGHYYVVRFGDGRTIRSRSLWDQRMDLKPPAPGATALERRDGPRSQQLLAWSAGYEKSGRTFAVTVAEDITPLLGELRRLLVVGVAASVLTALALLLIQRRLLRHGFRRIDAVRADIRRLDSGEIDRLSETVPAEVQPLVRELNQLIDAWRSHLARSRNAMGNLAHALKSPLNLILLHHAENKDDPVAAQALRMRDLIERELRRARLAGEHSPGRRFQPPEDVADLVDVMRTLYSEKALDITTEIQSRERLVFDQEDMLELTGNLLDNACKWARKRVHLSLSGGESLLLRVEDDGPGVGPRESALLAMRGERLDESTPGHGLGLAIVGEIVRLHGGSLELDRSQKLGGFAAAVELPYPKTSS